MWLRVLGSAAGGGFPQWNCGCPGCRAVRDGSRPCQPRTQSSIAVSVDYQRWFLFNASPDLRAQIESFPALRTAHGRRSRHAGSGAQFGARREHGRATPMAAVLLTDAELDHTMGLLLLREGRELELHATTAAYQTLRDGNGLLRTLEAYCPVKWRTVQPGVSVSLADGLTYQAFDVPTSKRARFVVGAAAEGRVIGYRLTDEHTGGTAVYLPGVQDLTPAVLAQLNDCDCLLVDGTCWRDDELIELGLAGKTSREMGHMPIDGEGGSLARLAELPIARKIYLHMNNTNPILLDDAPERRLVEERGMEVAMDGLEVRV